MNTNNHDELINYENRGGSNKTFSDEDEKVLY